MSKVFVYFLIGRDPILLGVVEFKDDEEAERFIKEKNDKNLSRSRHRIRYSLDRGDS